MIRRHRTALWALVYTTVLAAAACSKGGTGARQEGGACTVTITKINGDPAGDVDNIVAADDSDLGAEGIQLDVTVAVANLPDGAEIILTGGFEEATATSADGEATFDNYTVAHETAPVALTARATAFMCRVDDPIGFFVQAEPVTCQFVTPALGALLNTNDDLTQDTSDGTINIDVQIASSAPDGSTVTLEVGGGTATANIASSVALFSGVALACPASGIDSVLIAARIVSRTGDSAECSNTVRVACGFTTCDVVALGPEACTDVGSLGTTCNASNDADPDAAGLQIDVTVESDASGDATVALSFEAETPAVEESLEDGQAVVRMTLPEGDVSLEALCTDDSGNTEDSRPFNVYVDTAPPAAVADLACAVTANDPLTATATVSCTFTVPEDAGAGAATYDLRHAAAPIDEDTFDDVADSVAGVLTEAAGSSQAIDVEVEEGATHYFALRTTDLAGNASNVSNLPDALFIATGCDIVGFSPDAIVTTLGTTLNATHDGDAGTEGLQIVINVATDAGEGGSVTLAIGGEDAEGSAEPEGGTAALATTLPEGALSLVATCVDGDGNTLVSAAVDVFVDTLAPDVIADLVCAIIPEERRAGGVECSWSTPGDADGSGVEAYDLRYATNVAIDADTWLTATAVSPAPLLDNPVTVAETY
ncbi:MAG: hypothetical protein AABZ30_06660, partial [Myxococcota bacterium]